MKIIFMFLSIIVLFFSGCTSKVSNVVPLNTDVHHIYEICIEKNNQVIVHDFLPFVIEQFKKHNIKSKIYNESIPDSCFYSLNYSANKHWDMVMYFRAASLDIYNKGKLVASVKYETQNGLDMSKFDSMEKKFTPIIEELLRGHTPPSVDIITIKTNEENTNKDTNFEHKLTSLKKMNDNGLISNEEYTIKRKQLLEGY